jgi:hypothetical protein
MTMIDLDALTSAELYGDLCNIIERNYQKMPLPGTEDDDGMLHTSSEARHAANAVLDAIYRTVGAERPRLDVVEGLKGLHPGHSDEWYVALAERLRHSMRTAAIWRTLRSCPTSSGLAVPYGDHVTVLATSESSCGDQKS